MAARPVRRVDRLGVGVHESSAAMGVGEHRVRRGSRVRISRRRIWAGSDAGRAWRGWLGRAPERRAVEGLSEVRDGHVVRLGEGRGRLDLEVRRLDRERGQTAGIRSREEREERRAREERHVHHLGHSRRAREGAAPPRHRAGRRRFGRRSAASLPRRRRMGRVARVGARGSARLKVRGGEERSKKRVADVYLYSRL